MKKKIWTVLLVLFIVGLIAACVLFFLMNRHTEHTYDNACDTTCNECGETRNIVHTYDNACDTMCNICGTERKVADHTYDNDQDVSCNICGYERVVICTHEYNNDCDVDCNICGEIREVGNHIYDNDCDTECNECNAVRVTEHTYDNACDTECNVCGETRVTEHVYDNTCDTECNTCGKDRVIEHVYDNACDTTCNNCYAEREIVHTYDNVHDADCNICGDTREVANHDYDNDCDKNCNTCGFIRDVNDHVYDNDCDPSCNECEAVREIVHVYDNIHDADCNICGDVREVADHDYDHGCDEECNTCGFIRETSGHVYLNEFSKECMICGYEREIVCNHEYDSACDVDCNLCGEIRNVEHTYDNSCDTDCNICGMIRKAEHQYDNDCDDNCNVCGTTRQIVHTYDNSCDTECNICGFTREANHEFSDGCDNFCNTCGYERVTSHEYSDSCDEECNNCGYLRNVEHIDNDNNNVCDACSKTMELPNEVTDNINAFVDHWNNAIKNTYSSIFNSLIAYAGESYTFENIKISGEWSDNLPLNYVDYTMFNQNTYYYKYNDGSNAYIANINNQWVKFGYDSNGKLIEYTYDANEIQPQKSAGSVIKNLPLISIEDVVYDKASNTYSISSSYLESFFDKLYSLGISTTHKLFGNRVHLFCYSGNAKKGTVDFINGQVNRIYLTDANSLFEIEYVINTNETRLNLSSEGFNTTLSFSTDNNKTNVIYRLVKSEEEIVCLDASVEFINTPEKNSEDIADIYNIIVQEKENLATALKTKYAGPYLFSGKCDFVVYDSEYNQYIYFKRSGKNYTYASHGPERRSTFCLCEIVDNELFIIEHYPEEAALSTAGSKYNKTYYTTDQSESCNTIVVYDAEYDAYIMLNRTTGNAYRYYTVLTKDEAELLKYCEATIDGDQLNVTHSANRPNCRRYLK